MGSIWHWAILLIFGLLWAVPIWRIASRVGLNKWLAIFGFFSFIGPLIVLWYLAFARWNTTPPAAEAKNIGLTP